MAAETSSFRTLAPERRGARGRGEGEHSPIPSRRPTWTGCP